jgi:hypothetical protein
VVSFVSCFDRYSLTIPRWLFYVNEATLKSGKPHRDDGFSSGAGVTRNYTDVREGCLQVDLSIDAGAAAGRAGNMT